MNLLMSAHGSENECYVLNWSLAKFSAIAQIWPMITDILNQNQRKTFQYISL